MANRTVPKKKHFGYVLYINRTGEKGAHNWSRVGDSLFGSSYLADAYRQAHFPNMKYQIQGVNLDPRPLVVEQTNKGKNG